MDSTAPLSGSPLIPLDIIAAFVTAILLLLSAIYLVTHFKLKASPLVYRIKLLTLVTAGLLTFLVVTGTALALYWLVPTPHIVKTDPTLAEVNYSTSRKIEIVFDRPVSRALLEKSIAPEVPGVWVFENSTYRTHLMRRVVFYPQVSLAVDTEYTISLKNIENVLRKSAPYNYELKFKTQTSPTIARVVPGNNEKGVAVDTPISVYLSAPDGQVSQFEFEISPTLPFSISLDQTKTLYTLTPKEPMKQGTRYHLKISKSDVRRHLGSGAVVETGQRQQIYSAYFTTKIPVGIDSIYPTGNSVTSKQPVTIRFTKEMDEQSVLANFSIEPAIKGTPLLIDHIIFVFTPKEYDFETSYTIRLAKGTKSLDGSFLDTEMVSSFTTLGRVKIENSFPKNATTGITVNTPLSITFDQEVDQKSVEARFSLTPSTSGKIGWMGKSMTFTPDKPWQKDTVYVATLKSGIKSRFGLDSTENYQISFSTVQSVFKLSVPVYLQQHTLSCELATLRMALAYRQFAKTEEELLIQVGYDPSPRRGNIWGDPYETFVGNIDGKQMSTGYGVYWPPIARVANLYTKAAEFSGLSITDILKEVERSNPVIIWTYSKSGIPTYWFTTSGERIFAASGEHTVVVVGFVGSVDDPSQIIVNDPLIGQIYLSLSEFTKRAAIFANSGVIVY